MLLAYLDESYTAERFYMSAAIAPEDVWVDLGEALVDIRKSAAHVHQTPIDAEFHACEIMGGRGPWKTLRGKHREAAGVYRSVLQAAREAGVKFVLSGLDVSRLNSRFKYPKHPYVVVLEDTLRLVNEYAAEHASGEPVELIVDQASNENEHNAAMIDHEADGTARGFRPGRFPHLAPHLNFRSSAQSPGLQVADLAVYLHRRRDAHPETHPAALRERLSLERQLDPAVVASYFNSP